jgi:AraC-like DNA-binding protein
MASINTHYILSAMGGAKAKGLETDPLLEEAGIPKSQLSNPSSRFHVERVALLYDGIAQAMNDECMGFTEHPIKAGTFELMTEWVSHSATLEELLRKGIRFYNQITNELSMALDIEGEHVYLTTELRRPELDFEHFYIEYWQVIWHRFACWYIDQPIKLVNAYINYQPIDPKEFALLFRCPTNFKSKYNRLVFHKSYLEMPLVKTPSDLRSFLQRAPVDLLTIPGEDTSLSAKARQILEPKIFRDNDILKIPNSRELAKHLAMSEQTMRRKLSAEGTSFQQIKDDVRYSLANQLLKNSALKIAQISQSLGFSEARAFSRAYQQWAGITPKMYRAHRRKHHGDQEY